MRSEKQRKNYPSSTSFFFNRNFLLDLDSLKTISLRKQVLQKSWCNLRIAMVGSDYRVRVKSYIFFTASIFVNNEDTL